MAKESKPKDSGKPEAPKKEETKTATDAETQPILMGKGQRTTIGISLVVVAFLLGYLIFALWAPIEVTTGASHDGQDQTTGQNTPATTNGDNAQGDANVEGEDNAEGDADTGGGAAEEDETAKISEVTVSIFGGNVEMSDEVRLVLLVLLVGLIGSYIQATISFVNFAGNRKLVKSWLWYYVARPFAAGPFLALIFYFVVRGGLLSTGADSTSINQYMILGVCGLAGLFSKQTVAKLKEVFTSLFRPPQDKNEDKMTGKQPAPK